MSFSEARKKKTHKGRMTEILEWLIVLLLILLSGCAFFTQAHRIETSIALMVCTILYCWNRKFRLKKQTLKVWAFIVLVLFVSFIANANSMTSANIVDYALIIVAASCLAVISTTMPLEVFQDKYIKMMCVICLISLVCFYIQITNYALVHRLGSTNVINGYIVSWYHTWGWSYIFARNAGPFWEPGAFQGYLFLAILFILNTRRIKEHYISLVLLTIGVMTTLSTTGYALLGIISVYFIIVYWQTSLKGSRDKIWALIKIVAVMAIAVFLIRYIIESNVITNKLSSGNESFAIRMLHLRTGLGVAMQRPLFGYGVSSPSLRDAIGRLGMNSNSVGIFSILQYFGIFLGSIYIIANFYATCKVYRNLNAIVVIVIFSILHLTEGLLLFPVYMGFLFFMYSRSKEVSQ